MVALIYHSGFETGDFGEWLSTAGTVSVVEANGWGAPKTGTYAMRCDVSLAAAYALTGNTYKAVTFYLYIVSASDHHIGILGNAINDDDLNLRITPDKRLKLYGRIYAIGDGTTTLETGVWYRISVAAGSTSLTPKVWLNGILEITGELPSVESHFDGIFGIVNAVATADIYFDDFAGDSTINNADLGDIRVAAASPNLAGTYAQYDTSSGYTNVDEIPASDADFIEDNGADVARESYNIPDLASLAGASSGDTVNAVSLWIRGDRDGGGGTLHKAMVRDDGLDYESDALDFDSIAWFSWYFAVMPKDSAAWSEARLNSLEIGAYHSGAQDQRVHCLVAMVAYTPSEEEPPEGVPAQAMHLMRMRRA